VCTGHAQNGQEEPTEGSAPHTEAGPSRETPADRWPKLNSLPAKEAWWTAKVEENEEAENEEVDNEEVDNKEVDNEEVDNEEVDNEEAETVVQTATVRQRSPPSHASQRLMVELEQVIVYQPMPIPPREIGFLRQAPDPDALGVSSHAEISVWLESLQHQETNSQPVEFEDNDHPVVERGTQSAPPVMGSLFAPPENVASNAGLVCEPSYRLQNLISNNVVILNAFTPLPEDVHSHVFEMQCSPGPKPSDDPDYEQTTELTLQKSVLMSPHLVPGNDRFSLSQPKPNSLFGYSSSAFTPPQLLAEEGLNPGNAHFSNATAEGLKYPFLTFQDIAPTESPGGDIWVAENQCAGASAACLNAIQPLISSVPRHWDVQRVDNVVYSLVRDRDIAQLYVSWRNDAGTTCYVRRVGIFLLNSPNESHHLHTQVSNILRWGNGRRLNDIRSALNIHIMRTTCGTSSASSSTPEESFPYGSYGEPIPLWNGLYRHADRTWGWAEERPPT
jgi:hypothetical protein